METIAIHVNDATGKMWRETPEKYKKEISEKIANDLSKLLDKQRKEKFLQYLDELGTNMKERGMTEEVLNDILKDDE